jgi:hypothetical protein
MLLCCVNLGYEMGSGEWLICAAQSLESLLEDPRAGNPVIWSLVHSCVHGRCSLSARGHCSSPYGLVWSSLQHGGCLSQRVCPRGRDCLLSVTQPEKSHSITSTLFHWLEQTQAPTYVQREIAETLCLSVRRVGNQNMWNGRSQHGPLWKIQSAMESK